MDFIAFIASWRSSFFLPSTLNSLPWIFICIFSLSFFISAITFLAFSWLIPSFNSLTCLMDHPDAPSELLTSDTLGSTFLLIKWVCSSSFTCFNFNSSGAVVVIVLSFRSIVMWSPLKSYRLPISLKQLAKAVSYTHLTLPTTPYV